VECNYRARFHRRRIGRPPNTPSLRHSNWLKRILFFITYVFVFEE
jgi:hypothetical protein